MNIFKISLTKRYISAVTLIAIFVISSNILNTNLITKSKEHGKIINISGKQRMLSQKLVTLGVNYISHKNYFSQLKLEHAITEITASHKYLLTKVFTPELENIYKKDKLKVELILYVKNFRSLLATDDIKYLDKAMLSSDKILKKLNKAVKAYERYANEQLEIMRTHELYLLLITLFILLMEIIFIFNPAAKQIEKDRKELQNKEEYEKAVIESSSNAVIAIDWTSKITTYNQKAQEMFGWTKEEMLGTRNLLHIIPIKYQDRHNKASAKYLSTGVSKGTLGEEHELEGRRKDGSIFPIIISFGAKYKPKGSLVVANISDISFKQESDRKLKALNESLEQKVSERTHALKNLNENLENIVDKKTKQNTKQLEVLQQQSKMAQMGEMIGAIAHQWRQPLNELGINIQNLKYDYKNDEINETFIKNFITNNKQIIKFMSQTIDDFRSFFRVDKEIDNFSIKEAIEKTISMQATLLKQLNIVHSIEGDNFNVNGFKSEFQQVILNIVNNAKDALIEKSIKNPEIKIVLNNNIITIEDNAGGIPDNIINRIFEPYFTTKEQGKGTGIGLYMSKMIIEDNMNAKLSVKNNTKGAIFSIDCRNAQIKEISLKQIKK